MSALDLSPENAPAVSLPSLTVVEPSEDDERALASLLDGEAARVVLHTQADLLGGGQVAAPPSSDSALRESAGTLQLQEDLTKVYPEAKGTHWDPKRHPRWPKGTPGGKGGRWMRVGERFLFKGVEYDITYVGPGELYAHVATKGTKNVPDTVHFTMKQETAKAAGYSDDELKAAGLKPEDKVDVFAGVERPPAEAIKASKKTESESFTGTVLDPYVHPETHDPSIPIPKGAEERVSPEEWERFGAIDQKRFSQLMELYGVWSSGEVKTRMDKAKQDIDPTVVELLEDVYGSQYGGSSGMTISLHGVYAGVLGMPAGSEAVEKARDKFETAKAAQDELAGLIQWDLYNRVRGPDIAMFHKSGYIGDMHEPPWWQENMIDGNKPIFAGLSQSQSYSAIGGHKPVVATPMAIRHVVFSTISGNVVNKYHDEQEVAVGDAYMADSNTRVWWYADSSGSGDLTKTQDDYLKKTTKEGASGEVLKLVYESIDAGDGGADLPMPPASPDLQMNSTAKQWDEPPAAAVQFGQANLEYEKDENGNVVWGPAAQLGLQPGDFIEGNKGTRYIVIKDPLDKEIGLRYYQITNQGEAIPGTEYEVNDGFTKEGRLFTNHKPYANDGGSTWQFEGGGKLAFKKLKGHYELPKPTTVSGFNEHAWVLSAPDQVKALGKFGQGEKFKLNGLFYEVTENLGNGWVKVQDLKTGDTGKINADYKSTYLVLEKGYSETGAALVSADDYWKGETKLVGELPDQIAGQKLLLGQTIWEAVGWEDGKLNAKVVGMTHDMAEHELKQLGKTAALGGTQKATLLIEKPFGWKPAKVGDMLSIDGQKASVTKIWKSGVVQVKKSKGGVIKFDPSDPALGELYTPDDWVLGNKEKLKSLAPGDLFHGGTGVKQIHPYRVIGAEGTNVKVKNLETGDELVLSGEKSYTRLVSAFQPLPSEAVPEDHVTPVDPGSGFVPDAWEPGAPTTADVLKFGDKITYMGTPYEVVEVPEEGQLGGQMKNLLTGEVKPFAAKSTIPVTLLQPKGGLLGTTPETFNLAQWVKKPGAQELVGPGLVGPTPLKTLDVGDVVQMKSDNVYKITAKEHGKVFATLLAKPSGKGTKFDPGHEATLEPNAFGYVLQPKAGPVELPAPVGAPSVQPGEFDPNQWEEEGKAGPASKWLSTPGTLFRVVKSGNVFVVGDHGMVTLLKGKTGSHVEGDTWEFPTNLPAVKLAPKQPLAVALEGPTPDTFDPAQWTIKTGEQVTAASDAKWDKGGIYQYVATGTWLKVLGASADGAKVQVLTGSAIHPPGYEYTLVADAVLAKAVPIAQAAPKTLGAHTPEAAPGVTPKPTGLADADAGFKGDLGGWPSDWEEGEKVTFGDLAVGDVFHGDSNVAHVKLEAGMAVNLSAGNTHDAFVFESKVTVLRPKETAVTPTAQAVHTIVHTPQAAPGITPNPTTADAEEQWHSSSGKIPDDWHFGDVIDSKDLLPGDVFQGTKVGAPHLKVADHTFVNLSDGAAHAYAGLEGDVKLIVPNEVAPGVPPTLPGLSMLVTPEEHAAAHPTGTSFASKSWADLEVGDVYASYSTAKTALSNKGLWVVTGKGGGKVFSARLGEPGKTVDHLFSDSTAQVYSYGRLKPPEPTTAELWLANKDKWTLAKSVAKQAVKPFADFNAGDIVKAQHSGSVWVVKSKTKTGKVKIELLEVGPNAKAEEAPGKKMLLSPAVAKGLKGDLMVLKPEVPGPDVLDEPDEMQEPWQTVEWTQAAAAAGTPPPGWTKAEDTVGFGDLKPGDVFRSWGGTGMPSIPGGQTPPLVYLGDGKYHNLITDTDGEISEVSKSNTFKLLVPPPQVVEGPSDEEVAAQGSGKLPTGFDPAAWVGDGKPGQVMDLKAGDVFLGTDGKLWQVRKPSQKGFVMAQVIDLATGLNGSAGAMVPYKEKVSQKAVSVTPYESLLPGDAATLDKLQVGDQFRLNLGGDLFQVMAMKPYGDEQEVTVTAVQADGMPDPSFFKLAPGVGTYLHAKAADVPLPVADKNDYLTDVESLPDAVATNGYKSYAFHKSGTKKYPKIQTMAEGTIFHDSAGTTYKVKKAGVAPVITDGKKLFKINGNLRGFVLPDGKLDDAAAPQPVMDAQTVQSAGAKAGLTDNAKSQAISELKLKVGDHVFFDPKTMGLLGSDEVWQVTALDKPSLSVSLYGLATGKTKAVSTTMVPSMYKVAPEAPSLFPEVQPGAEGIPGPEAFTVSVNLPADLGVGDYFSIDAAGGPKQTVWQVTKKAGGHATEFVMVQGVNVGKKYGGVSMPQSGLMAKGALKQAPGAVPQTGYQPYSSEAELSVGDFFTYKSPEAQPDTTIWQVLEMSGGKVTGYREVWSAGKPKPDGLEKHGEAGDVGMLAAGWYAKGGAPAGEWGSGPTSPKIANPEDWNPAAWTKGGTMDLSDVPAGTFVAWNSGYYKVLGEDPKYPQYKAKFMQGLGPDASQQYSGDLGKSSAVGDTNVTIMTPDPTVTVPGAPSQYTKLVGDDPASFVPEMWEPTGQVMDMEDAPDGSVVHKLDYGTKAPTGKYLYVVDSSTYQGSEPGKFGKNVKSLGEDAGYDYPHSGASPVEIMQPKLAGTPAAPTPAVPQTLPPESPVLAKKAKMGELPVGALVQSGGYTGKVSKVISHDAGGEYPQTQLEVVKPDSEPGSSPYGNEIGNTWSVYSTNPATPLIGPMWKPGEIVKVVKTGNKTGKTAKIIEGGNSKVTIKYADGKVASNVPVEWLHPVTGVHYTTKQKLKMDTRPGKSLNVGDVVTSAYGGPQVVIEKDGEGGGTLLNWGADPVSPMWYQKTPIKVDQDYEMLMTAGQLTRGAGGPLPEAMPSGPPPAVPSPDDFVHLETVAAGNFSVGTVFAVEDPKTHPDAPMWKVTKQNPSSTELMIVKADVSGMAGNQAQPVSSEWNPSGGFWVAHELTAKIVPHGPVEVPYPIGKQPGKKADWEHVEPGDFLGVAPTVLRVISQKPDDQVMTQIVSGASDLQGDFTDGDLFLAGLGPNAQWSWAAPVTMPKVPHKGAWLDQVEPGDVLENHDGSNVVQVTGKTGATVHTKVLKSSAQNMQDHPVGAAWDISLKGHLLKPESEGVPGGVEHGGHSWRWADPAEVLKAAELEPLGKQVGQPVDSPMDLSKGDIIVFDKGGDAESTWKVVEPPDAPSAQFQLQALAVPDHNLVDVKPGDEQAHSFLGGMSASHWTWGDPSLKEMTFGGPESEPALAPSGEFNPDQWEAAPEQLDPDELDSLPLGTIVTDELSAPSNPWFWELVGHDPPMVKVLWSQSGSFMGDVDPAAEFTSTQFQVSTPKGQKPVSPTAGFNVSSLPAPSGEFNPDEWEAANEELDAPELDSLPLGTVLTDPLSSPNNVWFYEVVEHDPPMVKILHTPGAGHFIGDVDSAEDYGPYQIATPKGTTPVVVSPTASFDKTRYEVAGAMATVSELKPGTVITDNKGHHWWKVVDPETRDLEILVWPENPASAGSHDKADSDGKFVPMQPKGTPVKREWKPGDSVTFTEGGSWYEGEVVGPGQHPGDVMVGITGSSDTGTEGKTWAIPAEWLLPLKVEGPTKGPRKGSPLMTPAEFNPDEWELDDVYEAGDLSDSVGAVIHTLPPSSDSYYQVIEPAVAADTGMPAPRVRTLLTHGESPAPGVEFVLYPGAKAELLKPKVSEPEIAPVDPKILDTSINPLSVSPGDYIYGGTKKTTYQVVGIPYYSGGDLVADLKDTKTGKVEQKQALTTFWQWAPDPGGATTSGAAGKFNPEDWEAGGLKLQTLAGIETLAPGTIVTDGPGETEVPWWWEVVDPAAGKLKLLWMSNGPPSESVLKGTEDAKDWLPLWSATRKGAAAAPGPPGEPLDVLKPYSPKYHKSGSHKTPQIGTLAVGQQFHDKSGKTYEVVSNSGGVDGSVNYRLVVEAAPGLGEMLYVTSGQSRVVVKGT